MFCQNLKKKRQQVFVMLQVDLLIALWEAEDDGVPVCVGEVSV